MSVEIVKNILERQEYNEIMSHIFLPAHNRNWSIQKHFWENKIQDLSLGVVGVFQFEKSFEPLFSRILQKYIKPNEEIHKVQYYEWYPLSQINWHNDPHVTSAITIYLNDKWNPDWGGYFCWKLENEETGHILLPMFNQAVILRGNPNHSVSLINPYAPVRKTIQVWIREKSSSVSQTM